MLYKMVLTFQIVGETLLCEHSHKAYGTVLSCTIVYFPVQGADLIPAVDPVQNLFAQTVHLYQSGFDRSLYFVPQIN